MDLEGLGGKVGGPEDDEAEASAYHAAAGHG
jgi:hypothetical protein